MICGDSIRVVHPLFPTESDGSIPISPLQLWVEKISVKKARRLNALWHSRLPIFETGCLLTAKICYGADYKNRYYAVAIWGNPVARHLPQNEWLELKRFAIADDSPKNTASWMLGRMTKLIKKEMPFIEKLISYQDVEVHNGTIYKAAGWMQGNYHSGASWYSPNSFNKCGTKRLRPDLNKAIGPKIRWEKNL